MAAPSLDHHPRSGPLVGRTDELRAVASALGQTGEGPRAVVLCGEEGVGKTRLAREALATATELGWACSWVAATRAAAGIPFGAVAHLLPATAPVDRFQLVRAAAQALTTQVDGRRSVVAVDDAHLLDDASAALVHHLVVTGAAFVVATVRAGVEVPEAVTTLWKDGLATRIEVPALTPAETAAMVEALLAGAVDAVTHRRLWQLSAGNALYVRELLRGGVDTGALTRRGGVWSWQGVVVAVPRLVEVLAHRLGSQPTAVHDLLDVVAFGEPVGVTLLERAGIDPAAIEAAEDAGLLDTVPSGPDIDVRLAHPLVGTVARARSSPLHRLRVSARLARAADAGPGTGAGAVDLLRSTVWHLDGGVPLDPAVLTAAARRALAVLDLPLAQRFALAAVEADGGPGAEALLAPVLVHCGAATEAEAVFARLAVRELPDEVAAELAAVRAFNLVYALERPDDAETVLDQAAARGPVGRDLATVARAQFRNLAGDPTAAETAARTVIDRDGARDEVLVRGLVTVCQSLAVQGRYADAVAAGERAAALARRLDGAAWSMTGEEVRGGLTLAHLTAGRLDAAQPVVEVGRELSTAAGWHIGAAVWGGWAGELALARGLPRTALRQLREALALTAGADHPYRDWVTRILTLDQVQAAALLGLVDEASAAAARFAELGRPWTAVLQARAGGATAWLALARGEVTGAIEEALRAADHAARRDQHGWELAACHLVVRLGAADRVADRLVGLGRRVDGPLAALAVRHGLAAARRDGAALEGTAEELERLGHVLLAAEAAAQAAGVYRAHGRPPGTTRATVTARSLAARCQGARTPALAALTEPSGLTRRENEIARLAARGMSNRAIAESLVISVRTVDNTLHQAYAKLGVAGRAALAPLFPVGEPSGAGARAE